MVKRLNRREFISKTGMAVAGVTGAALVGKGWGTVHIRNPKIKDKIFVLGIDGMDPGLLQKFVRRGEMKNFQRLMKTGYFGPLGTTMPPQSPVAWSSFISGANPGVHGIFDFIHRDPKTFIPFLSTSRSFEAEKTLKIGNWAFPIKGGHVDLLRRGPTFWHVLEDHDIPATLFKIPANFPIQKSSSRQLSGLGTPDLMGSYGIFTYFTDVEVPNGENMTGGRVVRVMPKDHVIRTQLMGPINHLRKDRVETKIDFTVFRDPVHSVVRIVMQDRELILKEGEWSDWIPLKFELLPLVSHIDGMVRIYIQQVHPHFRMYFSPINIDPKNASLPISSPPGYAQKLTDEVGRFYTQGFPEDTKALTHGIFSNEEFLSQSKIVLDERLKAFQYEFNRFKEGLFFFYFSSIDQNTHMMYRTMDPTHPLYEPNAPKEVKDAVYFFYQSMDAMLGCVLNRLDNRSSLIVMSDHGFAPFGREFHLSTWLVEQGYTTVHDPKNMHKDEFYESVNWSKTQAFAMGLNGLYINVRNRERNGSVFPQDTEKIKEELIHKLEKVIDPKTGQKVIKRVYDSQKLYTGRYKKTAPDLIVGYQRGYRISDEAVLGKFPKEVIGDRKDKWSADHCMDPSLVPGVLLSNREVKKEHPDIWDLAPTILEEFGLKIPGEMDGKSVFS